MNSPFNEDPQHTAQLPDPQTKGRRQTFQPQAAIPRL